MDSNWINDIIAAVSRDGKHLCFYFTEEHRMNDNEMYYIPVDDLLCDSGLRNWKQQIECKSWMTPRLMRNFLSEVRELRGRES